VGGGEGSSWEGLQQSHGDGVRVAGSAKGGEIHCCCCVCLSVCLSASCFRGGLVSAFDADASLMWRIGEKERCDLSRFRERFEGFFG
jgi:hypothetical protein